jgi:hypothetical protein
MDGLLMGLAPVIEIKFGVEQFARKAVQLGAAMDQLPFALSRSLNAAVTNARTVLVRKTWPESVQQRNVNFISAALRTNFSTKRNLRVEIYDRMGRAHLALHAHGGTKLSRKRLAIPQKGRIVFTSQGPRKSQTPKAIVANTPKRALRITSKGIFVGQGGRLNLMYSFAPSAQIRADVPFEEDFAATMRVELRTSFPAAMASAMKGRRV